MAQVAQPAQLARNDLRRFGGLGLVASPDHSRFVEGNSSGDGGGPFAPLLGQDPFRRSAIRPNLGKRMLDQNELAHASFSVCQ